VCSFCLRPASHSHFAGNHIVQQNSALQSRPQARENSAVMRSLGALLCPYNSYNDIPGMKNLTTEQRGIFGREEKVLRTFFILHGGGLYPAILGVGIEPP
jgi:hypothetical protein